jgi:hypothetical protein
MIGGPVMRELTDELEQIAHRSSGGFLAMTVESSAEPAPPEPLVEPADMVLVASPCHPWEPVKVAETWLSPLHCLVCGDPYSVG